MAPHPRPTRSCSHHDSSYVRSPKYDWDFHTVPQTHLSSRPMHWPRGRVLGGSSAINFLMHAHASRRDLDNWEALGNAGWNFDALQPFYRRSETFHLPSADAAKQLLTDVFDPACHGSSGPVQTGFPEGSGLLDNAWPATWKALGMGPKADPRKGDTLGGYAVVKTMDVNARRSHSANAYLSLAEGRDNLAILTGAFVDKVLLEKRADNVKATGVKFIVGDDVLEVKTKGEIILSAGTVKSPQILELSGIGSRELLEKHGIEVIVDNDNVGENLQVRLMSAYQRAKQGMMLWRVAP